MEGTPTYVVLPEELWTPEIYEMKRKGGSPVFPSRKLCTDTKTVVHTGKPFVTSSVRKPVFYQFQTIGLVPIIATKDIYSSSTLMTWSWLDHWN